MLVTDSPPPMLLALSVAWPAKSTALMPTSRMSA
jgi:hypothetical protein